MQDPVEPGNDAAAGSPLAAFSYDFWRGDHDLARFVDSDVEAFMRSFHASAAAEQEVMRGRLSLEDLSTLLAFARRCGVRSLRSRDQQIARDGVNAISVVDPERVDERDIPRSLAPARWVLDEADAVFGDLAE